MEPLDFSTKRKKSHVVDSGDTSNNGSLKTSSIRQSNTTCPPSSSGCSELTNSPQSSPVTELPLGKSNSLKPYKRPLMNASVSKPSSPVKIKSTNSDQMRSTLSEFNQLSRTTLSVKNKVSAHSPGNYSPVKRFPSTSGNSFMENQFPNFRNEKLNENDNLGSNNNNLINHFPSNEEDSPFLPSPQMSKMNLNFYSHSLPAYQSQFIQNRLLFLYFYNIYQRAAEIQSRTNSLSPFTFQQSISQGPHLPSTSPNSQFLPLPNLLPIGQIPSSPDQENIESSEETNVTFRSMSPKKQIKKRRQNTFTSKNLQNQKEESSEDSSSSGEETPGSLNNKTSDLDSSNKTIINEAYLEKMRKNFEAAKRLRDAKR